MEDKCSQSNVNYYKMSHQTSAAHEELHGNQLATLHRRSHSTSPLASTHPQGLIRWSRISSSSLFKSSIYWLCTAYAPAFLWLEINMDQRHTQITNTESTGDGKQWCGNLDFPFDSITSKSPAGASLAYTPKIQYLLLSPWKPEH